MILDEQRLYSQRGETCGIDDPVVPLWQDLIDVASAALDPVPAALASRLAEFDRATWFRRAFERPRYGEGRWVEVQAAVIALEQRIGMPCTAQRVAPKQRGARTPYRRKHPVRSSAIWQLSASGDW